MKQEQINQAFAQFKNTNVLIIGDIMIDAYYWGNTERISPEAPVPILSVTKQDNRLGGAANVALNVQALGAKPFLCGVAGKDIKSNLLIDLMEQENLPTSGIVKLENRITTVKTRMISQQQHLLRVDEEITSPLNDEETNQFLTQIKTIIEKENIGVIIFEDYDKGAITPTLISEVVRIAKTNNIPVTVDPKKRQFLDYKDVTLFKPNLKELKEGLKIDIQEPTKDALDNAVQKLKRVMPIDMALITLSQYGVYIHNGESSAIIPAHIRNISDVSGAGDTVIAVASLCLAQKTNSTWMAGLANLAGGLVCEEVGVVPINVNRLQSEAERLN